MQKRRGRPPKSVQEKAQAIADKEVQKHDLLNAEIDALRHNLNKALAVIEYLEGRLALIRGRYEDTSI
jgi:ABC-type uncharacterized transport system involved in gliding motility auxiliary subunit